MNVNVNLLNHPKFKAYKRELGDPAAMEYLLRLWSHCQRDKRGENWGKKSEEYVEEMCEWPGERGKLFSAMSKPYCGRPGWIRILGSGQVVVTSWTEHNQSLVNNWNRNPGGVAKTAKATGTPRAPHGVATGRPRGTPLDLTGLDLKGEGTEANPPLSPLPEAAIPDVKEIVAYGTGPAGIPEEFCRHYFTQKQINKSWVTRGGQGKDWQLEVRTWWARDRHSWKPQKNGGEDADLAALEAQLEAATVHEKRAELKERIKKLRGQA